MWRRISIVAMLVAVPALAALVPALANSSPVLGPVPTVQAPAKADPIVSHAMASLERGRQTFRYDPFGSNLFFSNTLGLNEVLSQVTPRQALALGVKVDVDNLPPSVRRAIQRGAVDLDDPAVTRFLFERYAVVGVVANVEGDQLKDLGITCAFCHSTVDDSLAPGIGHRLDGWANRDLDVGAILSIAPNLQPLADLLEVDVETVKTVLTSWGPGKFDAHLNLDGVAFRPDGKSASVLIPPAFGLAGVNLHTYEGWGGVPYWNAYVGGHEMNGLARFYDPRLADAEKYPIAAKAGLDDIDEVPDLLTEHLADLHLYQIAIPAPDPPAGSFDVAAAERGETLFAGKAGCAECHVPPIYTEPGWNLHLPEEIGIDSFQADRGPEGRYRTTPLAGLWTHTEGGFYHDGRFPTLLDVIDHYDQHFDLELSESEKRDLQEFLKSL
ncbi:MAG TPA: hypothetical protein VHM02_15455 [Thermoanaerobaculia bacterium]|nr:hypothetical protein [Thermoanaerobaculia bacterium]